MADREIGEAARLEGMEDERAHRLGGIAMPSKACRPNSRVRHDLRRRRDSRLQPINAPERTMANTTPSSRLARSRSTPRHLLAIGMGDRAGQLATSKIAGKQTDARRIRKQQSAQQ